MYGFAVGIGTSNGIATIGKLKSITSARARMNVVHELTFEKIEEAYIVKNHTALRICSSDLARRQRHCRP